MISPNTSKHVLGNITLRPPKFIPTRVNMIMYATSSIYNTINKLYANIFEIETKANVNLNPILRNIKPQNILS